MDRRSGPGPGPVERQHQPQHQGSISRIDAAKPPPGRQRRTHRAETRHQVRSQGRRPRDAPHKSEQHRITGRKMSMPGPIGLIDGAITRPGRQRPCQHGVTCPVISGWGREVALPHHCQGRDHGNQTRRNGRPRERTSGAPAGEGRRSHGVALRLVTVSFCFCSILPGYRDLRPLPVLHRKADVVTHRVVIVVDKLQSPESVGTVASDPE